MDNRNGLKGMDRFCLYLSHRPRGVVIAILVVTAIFLYGALKLHGEVVIQELFPYNHPYLELHARFSEVFGSGGSGVVIAVKAKEGDIFRPSILGKVKKITEEIELWDEVYRILTVSMASRSVKVVKTLKKGEINIQPLMWPEIPRDSKEMTTLKTDIFSNPAYTGTLVSKDGTSALVMTEFRENISYQRAFSLLQKLRKDFTDGEASIHIVGFPMLMGWIYSLRSQTLSVFVISFMLMVIILFIMFRSILGMIAPMVNALILTILGLGFIGFTGINFSPLIYVLAFLMGARMISNSVQITYRYFEELHASGQDRIRASYETMRSMLFPNWAGVSTDMAGFAALYIAKIPLMQNLSIIMTFWMLTIGLTGIMVPAICSLIPLKVASEKYTKEWCQVDWQARAITKVTSFSIGSGKYVVSALIIGLLVFSSWQMSKLKIGDPSPGSPILWPDHVYNKDQALINQLFNASSENLMLYYEGEKDSVFDPVVLTTFEAFDRHMREKLPDIYKASSSVINMVMMMNLTWHDGDMVWYQLTREKLALSNLVGYIRDNTERGSLSRFIDDIHERAQTILFFSDHTSENLLRIRDAAYDFFRNRPMKIEKGEFKLAGGRIGMEIGVNDEIIHAHAIMDTSVLIAIFILITISFMSITGGLMVTLPLIIANSMAFAYMAFMDIGVTINTLPVAAAGLGIGDNFCIYLYSRCQEELKIQRGDWMEAIIRSVCTTGKAVVYTGITIILPILTWYLISDLKFQAEVGLFLAIILAANVILTLTLHPLLIYIIKPKFISKGFTASKAVEAKMDAAR